MKFSYGNGACCELESSRVTRIAANSSFAVKSHEVANLVRKSLAKPLDFPALASATVPGDCVAVTLEYGTACLAEVLEGVLSALQDAGVEDSSITVVLSHEFEADPLLQEDLRRVAGGQVKILRHHTDQESIAMLAVSDDGQPIRLNRAICDADLVIPVGSVAPNTSSDAIYKSIYPQLSDEETMSRFRNESGDHSRKDAVAREREMSVLGRFLGLGLVVQVVPGPHEQVGGISVGTIEAASSDSQSKYCEVWSQDVTTRGSLVIAMVAGGRSEQTWENVARAIRAAESVVLPNGAIAVCTELATRPGAAMSRLMDVDDYAAVERKLFREKDPESEMVRTIFQAIERGPVYLRSQLAPSLVESLAMTPVESNDELDRLVAGYHDCVVLEDAQHLVLSNTHEQSTWPIESDSRDG